jgi:transcriptional regulator with XRE-family HTH domain
MKREIDKNFGLFLKELRKGKGVSIKKLGPQLDINYSYISKLENSHTLPSEDLIKKIAAVFDYDEEELMLRAGKIPDDIIEILRGNPKEAVKFLRRKFES